MKRFVYIRDIHKTCQLSNSFLSRQTFPWNPDNKIIMKCDIQPSKGKTIIYRRPKQTLIQMENWKIENRKHLE